MAYEPTIWKNREVERPRTFTLQENDDGTVTLIPAEGKVTDPGTPIVAPLLNKIEGQLVLLDVEKASKQQESWMPAVLESGWSNVVGELSYYKDQFNVVHIRGVIRNVVSVGDTSSIGIMTLPVGYRPVVNLYLSLSETNPLKLKLVTITPDGEVKLNGYTANVPLAINLLFRVDE